MDTGDIVKLKQPYKPSLGIEQEHCQMIFYRLNSHLEPRELVDTWNKWPGFTHGVVVEIISQERGEARNVSLHLYEPDLGLLYMCNPDQHAIPTSVDFHVSELSIYKASTDMEITVGD